MIDAPYWIERNEPRSRRSKSGCRSRLIQTVGGAKNVVSRSRSISSRQIAGTGASTMRV